MDVQVISEKENPLLKRKEILASIDYQEGPTPSKADLQKILADQFKANIDNVEISKIMSEVGLSKGKIWIKIWQEKKVPIYAELKKEKKPKEKKKEETPKKEVEQPKAGESKVEKEEKKLEQPKKEEVKTEETSKEEEQKVEEKKE